MAGPAPLTLTTPTPPCTFSGMFPIDGVILLVGVLLALGIVSSKLSSRMGLPVLVLFLALGMLAGSEGLGKIEFENYALAHGVGTLALALILFDGGLRTPWSAFRVAMAPSVTLATGGVVITAAVTGLAASVLLGIPLLEGLLLGSIVGSTDAAAVFAVLRSKGVHLRERLAATLEIESGANDPMAIFLTIALIELLLGRAAKADLALLFAQQMVLGAVVGYLAGRLGALVINRLNLDAAGLYPVFTGSAALLAYGGAAWFGGSGFLAVYLAGLIIGNQRIVFQRGVMLFHDGLAWLGQILMFVILGLLAFPSQLAGVWKEGLLIAAVLILLARPLTVGLLLLPFRFSIRELAFISWVGLKGAVPIILATYPFLLGLPDAPLLFNVVFFVVFISAVLQGWSLPWVAKALRLQMPARIEPPVMLEITSLRDVDGDIVEYAVDEDSGVAGKRLESITLPEGVVVAMISREHRIIPPRGNTQILPGDHVFVIMRQGVRALVDRVFGPAEAPQPEMPLVVSFPLKGSATVAEIEQIYGIDLPAPSESTLDELLRDQLGDAAAPGEKLQLGPVTLTVDAMDDGAVARVQVEIGTTE